MFCRCCDFSEGCHEHACNTCCMYSTVQCTYDHNRDDSLAVVTLSQYHSLCITRSNTLSNTLSASLEVSKYLQTLKTLSYSLAVVVSTIILSVTISLHHSKYLYIYKLSRHSQGSLIVVGCPLKAMHILPQQLDC